MVIASSANRKSSKYVYQGTPIKTVTYAYCMGAFLFVGCVWVAMEIIKTGASLTLTAHFYLSLVEFKITVTPYTGQRDRQNIFF